MSTDRRGGFVAAAAVGLMVVISAVVVFVLVSGGDDGDGATNVDTADTTASTAADSAADALGDAASGIAGASATSDDDPVAPDPDDAEGTDGATPEARDDGRRFKVDTERVAADRGDPFLNVRSGSGTGSGIVAKLPANYTGVLWTGQEQTTADGDLWYEVELLDPVRVHFDEPLHGSKPVGWVNSALLAALPEGLPVTVDELAPCGTPGETIETSSSGSRSPGHVYAVDSALVSPDCLRVVVTFGTGAAPFELETALAGLSPADSLPLVRGVESGSFGVVVDLGAIDSVWPGATETDDGVYVVRRQDRTLELRIPDPVNGSSVTGFDDRGIVVVDLELDPDRAKPPAEGGVVLTRDPDSGFGPGSFEVTGITRPFEANLEVSVEDGDGSAVEAIFSGSLYLGTTRTDEYAVQTIDWTEAWAPFAVRVEDLAPGRYTMVLNANGGSDTPPALRIPFTVAERGSEPDLATAVELDTVEALVNFARGGGRVASVPLADEVTLGLGLAESRTLGRAELADADVWISDVTDFEGFSGDFGVLETLARSGPVRITSGAIPYCVGPPRDWPAPFDGLRQVNIEPIGVDSCIAWFGVSLFLNPAGEIEGVVLDLFGP